MSVETLSMHSTACLFRLHDVLEYGVILCGDDIPIRSQFCRDRSLWYRYHIETYCCRLVNVDINEFSALFPRLISYSPQYASIWWEGRDSNPLRFLSNGFTVRRDTRHLRRPPTKLFTFLKNKVYCTLSGYACQPLCRR